MTNEAELQKQREIAEAEKRLDLAGVREEVAGRMANYVGVSWLIIALLYAAKEGWHGWWGFLLAVAAYFVSFLLAKYPYDKEYDAASDAYARATKSGKYYTGQ